MNVSPQSPKGLAIPFDHQRLDRLMDAAGIDVVLATSKHNVQYLLGGHRADFFDYMDATGITRYLPVLVYPKGAPEKAAYIGHRLEKFQREVSPMWTPETQTNTWGSVDAMQKAVDHMRKAGLKPKRIAAEFGFLPYDASQVLRAAFPDAEWVDALFVLERQRVKKSPDELKLLKYASEAVIESMQAVIAAAKPGVTKAEVVEELRRAETNRGLTFEYCLITAGTSFNRAPSDQAWEQGGIMSIDSGGNYRGYIGDVCRMAIQGEPDTELDDLLGEIETIQRAAMKPIRSGVIGREIYAAAAPLVQKSRHNNHMEFLAHGMGMVSHEAPRLTDRGPVPYPSEYANEPLEAGMVVSVETTLLHPSRGFIKLEDTVVVTETGHEVYGEGARGWNKAGTAAG
ncbi:MAG TPA: Xaa-Pro peptidase family protein [Pseudolabrys sp.]|nr:Xaa-Pro peptidase family protein [Pseudolabrys sp.]